MKQYVIVLGILLLGLIAGATDVVLSKGYSIEGANVVISTTTTTTTTTLPGYLVTGNGISWDASSVNGIYTNSGDYNGKYSYTREDGVWNIWWNGINNWFISEEKGAAEVNFFYFNTFDDFTDAYFTSQPFCSGTPRATIIP